MDETAPDGWGDTDDDLIEAAWGLIAFAYSTPDAHDKADWREAAERWRDRYHTRLDVGAGNEQAG